MPQVEVKKGESVDRALKRLKSKLESEGVLEEVRRLRAFETPLQRFRRKQRTAAKKTRLKFRTNLNVFRRENTRKAAAAAAAAEGADAPSPAAEAAE